MVVEKMVIEPEMVVVPDGEFMMGCDTGAEDEKPVHSVYIDRFALGRFAVTNHLYSFFIDATKYPTPQTWKDPHFHHPDQPVACVSWFDATTFCTWLSNETGKPYRLPTEAEWERAARGGLEGRLYTWGDDAPQQQPGYFDRWVNGPERVGQRPPNGFGLHDISENVHEWCADWYEQHYYVESERLNPKGPVKGFRRASRGGSWRHQVKITRVAARSSIPPEFKYSDYGFRCAMSRE